MNQRVPDGVLIGLTVVLLGLGGAWWTQHAPAPAAADPGIPVFNRLVPAIGGGLAVDSRPRHRRCITGLAELRSVGQDDVVRC